MNATRQAEGSDGERQIANWKIVRPLGKGGMAEVFEAEDMRLGAHVALKLFACKKDDNGQIRERFLAEAALLARLNHPRLVRVFDYGIDPASDRPYFVMDLVLDPTGTPRTLADKQFAGADEDRVAMWYEDLRDALAFVHAQGVVHRDIKLQNVLVGPDGHAVLSDFGIAKIFDTSLSEEVGLSPEATLQTLAGGRRTVMGSIGYMAPELELGVAASPASDYYALGVLVFYLLTGTWCEPRTDILAELETYGPVWKEIIPKLLHSNPAARECPSWRECENRDREREAAEWEDRLDSLGKSVRDAQRSSRIAKVLAIVLGAGAVVLASMLAAEYQMKKPKPPRVRFEDICRIPAKLPASAKFTRKELLKAVKPTKREIDRWIRYVNRGEMSHQAAADVMDLLRQHPPQNKKVDMSVFQYMFEMARDNLDATDTSNSERTDK